MNTQSAQSHLKLAIDEMASEIKVLEQLLSTRRQAQAKARQLLAELEQPGLNSKHSSQRVAKTQPKYPSRSVEEKLQSGATKFPYERVKQSIIHYAQHIMRNVFFSREQATDYLIQQQVLRHDTSTNKNYVRHILNHEPFERQGSRNFTRYRIGFSGGFADKRFAEAAQPPIETEKHQ